MFLHTTGEMLHLPGADTSLITAFSGAFHLASDAIKEQALVPLGVLQQYNFSHTCTLDLTNHAGSCQKCLQQAWCI